MTMIKIRALFLVMMLAVCSFAASPQVLIDGSTSYEQARIMRLERSLNFTKEPMVSTWQITIWPGQQFDEYVRMHDLPTDAGFTFLGLNHTYINENYLVWHNDVDVQFLIAHEAGHMICDCRSEQKANEIAEQLGAHGVIR